MGGGEGLVYNGCMLAAIRNSLCQTVRLQCTPSRTPYSGTNASRASAMIPMTAWWRSVSAMQLRRHSMIDVVIQLGNFIMKRALGLHQDTIIISEFLSELYDLYAIDITRDWDYMIHISGSIIIREFLSELYDLYAIDITRDILLGLYDTLYNYSRVSIGTIVHLML